MLDSRDKEGLFPIWLVLTRKAILVALLASAALYAQYLDPVGASFCGLHSGCEAVRRSGLGYFGSRFLSIPLGGLVAYAVVFGVSLARPAERFTAWLATAGAVVALGLLLTQAFYVHAFCWLCCVVDATAILAAGFAWMGAREARAGGVGADPLRPATWVGLAVLLCLVPVGWVAVKPMPPVPAEIRALYVPGKINVVEFADFECPYCRALHPVLQRVREDYPAERVNFMRKQVPLPMHGDAVPAARADVCAEAQGKGEELANRLVTLDLTASSIRRAAVGVGVNPSEFDACLASKAPDARIAADTALLDAAGFEGLPTTYVGDKRLLGAVSEAAIRDAFDRAAKEHSDTSIPGPIYLGLAFALLAAVAWLGRTRRATLQHGTTG